MERSEIELAAIEFAKKVISLSSEPEEPKADPKTDPDGPDINYTRKLKHGIIGSDVQAVQSRLVELGYKLKIDGSWGNETTSRIMMWQEDQGITENGVIVEESWAILFSDDAVHKKPRPVSQGSIKAADIAEAEGKRQLAWRAGGRHDSEAEKYLKPFRKVLGTNSRFAWCGVFVHWCFAEAGVHIPKILYSNLTFAYTPAIEEWAKRKGTWHSSRDKKFDPRKGDIILFDWNKDADCDHVGIVLDYEPGSVWVKTAEGNTSATNQSNGDSTAIRKRHWNTIRGFVRLQA